MARSEVTIAELAINTFAAATADAIDATNHHVIDLAGSDVDCTRLMIEVTHTTGSAKVVTVKAGDNPPADAAGVGDLATSFADGSGTPVVKSIMVESARFIQSDGTIEIDVAASTTGSIKAFALPK